MRDRLSAARLYLCTDARERQGDLASFLDAVLSHGVDIVQLRQKELEAQEELRFLEVFRRRLRRANGALLAVNDRADVAYAAGADVLHLGQDDLPPGVARQIIGPGPLIGLSTHAAAEAAAASTEPAADYFCTGPVWPTPTKPGRPGAGPAAGRGTPAGLGTHAAVVRHRRHRRVHAGPGPGRRGSAGRGGASHHRGGRPGRGDRPAGRPAGRPLIRGR